jgi:hypothetical protein
MNRPSGLDLLFLSVIAGLLSFLLGFLGFSNPRGQPAGNQSVGANRAFQGAACRVG